MPRIDLVLSLIRAASAGDRSGTQAAAEAMASEEASRGHHVAAERILRALAPSAASMGDTRTSASVDQASDLFFRVATRSGLDGLDLEDRVRTELQTLVREQRNAKQLAASGLEARHRILLSGPPGNGKTSVAEAVAHDLEYPFLVVSYGSLIGSLLGETNRRIENLFRQAKSYPCVLFFDEFEAVGKERGDRQETGEMKRALASLLTQIDALPPHVVVIAATNHPEMLDRAVWRRFELKLVLKPPNYSRVLGYLVQQLKLRPDLRLIQTLGQCFPEKSYAELKDFTLDVRRRAVLDGTDVNSALREEITLRFPEIDWPIDVGSEQTSAATGPAETRSPKGRQPKRPERKHKVRQGGSAAKVRKPV